VYIAPNAIVAVRLSQRKTSRIPKILKHFNILLCNDALPCRISRYTAILMTSDFGTNGSSFNAQRQQPQLASRQSNMKSTASFLTAPATYGPRSSVDRLPLPIRSGISPESWVPYDVAGSTFFVGNANGPSASNRADLVLGKAGGDHNSISRVRPPSIPQSTAVRTTNSSFDLLELPNQPAPRRISPLIGPRPQPPDKSPSPTITSDTGSRFIPFARSSSILVHSGFWNILSAINNGSRFYTSALMSSPTQLASARRDQEQEFDTGRGSAERPPTGANIRAITSTSRGSESIQKRKVSADMIGNPRQFA
jgi:hypothetical protein